MWWLDRVSYIPSFSVITRIIWKSALKNVELFTKGVNMCAEWRIRLIGDDACCSSGNLVTSSFENNPLNSLHRGWRKCTLTLFDICQFFEVLIELNVLLLLWLHLASNFYIISLKYNHRDHNNMNFYNFKMELFELFPKGSGNE